MNNSGQLQVNREETTPLEILKSNIATIKSDIVFNTILKEAKSIRMENQNIQFLLNDTDEGIGLLNTAPQTKLNTYISTMLSEKALFDSNVNLFKIPKKKLDNPLILEKIEEAASTICSFETIPFCNCKPQKLKIIRETSEMAQGTLSSFFISFETILRRIIKNFQSSSKGELKLHTELYQTLYQPLKFIKQLRYFLRANLDGNLEKESRNVVDSKERASRESGLERGFSEEKQEKNSQESKENLNLSGNNSECIEPGFSIDHKKDCPITVENRVFDSTLNLYVKTSRDIYTSEFVRHFETIYDVIQNHRVKQGFNLNLLLESVFLIREGEMEFLKNAFEIQSSEKRLIFIQESLFDPLIDTIIQFIIDLYSEYKKDVLLMIWDVGNLLEQKYLRKRNFEQK